VVSTLAPIKRKKRFQNLLSNGSNAHRYKTVRLSDAIDGWKVWVKPGHGLGHELAAQRLVATSARFLSVRCYDVRTGAPLSKGASVTVRLAGAPPGNAATVGTLQTDPDTGVVTLLSTASPETARGFLAGPLEIKATSSDGEVRFTAATVDLTDKSEDGLTLDMPALTLYRVVARVNEPGSNAAVADREVRLSCSDGAAATSSVLATGTTDANGAFAFESTDAAWGKARGLKLEVSATTTHRAGETPAGLYTWNPVDP
jgi:hypothetical protein